MKGGRPPEWADGSVLSGGRLGARVAQGDLEMSVATMSLFFALLTVVAQLIGVAGPSVVVLSHASPNVAPIRKRVQSTIGRRVSV